ncbi:MAG TPA: OmpA family protein [Desulfocapsa sulfexigens]|nr:OmpA family protein [Desulfocapsa sulfexigens]
MRKKTKTILTLASLPGILIPAFAQSSQIDTRIDTIKQEPYTYQMDVTQTVTTDTFVIIEGSRSNTRTDTKAYSKKDKSLAIEKKDTSTSRKALATAVLSTCLFQFDSPVLIPSEIDKTLSILSKKNLQNTPLAVTGYTCSLGPKKYNQALSLQRAKAVADLLRRHDFTVATVQGKGSQNPVTNDPQQFRLNRRVTIQAVKK